MSRDREGSDGRSGLLDRFNRKTEDRVICAACRSKRARSPEVPTLPDGRGSFIHNSSEFFHKSETFGKTERPSRGGPASGANSKGVTYPLCCDGLHQVQADPASSEKQVTKFGLDPFPKHSPSRLTRSPRFLLASLPTVLGQFSVDRRLAYSKQVRCEEPVSIDLP